MTHDTTKPAPSTVDVGEQIGEKIVHLLKIYPKISPSMMQIGIGSSLPANLWRPVLQDLIARGIVLEDHIANMSAGGRNQTYTILSLNDKTFTSTDTPSISGE